MPDLAMAQQFLDMLGGDQFVFQTFTDNKQLKKTYKPHPVTRKYVDPLVKELRGTFDQHQHQLEELSSRGAGVFVMVNEGSIHRASSVTGVRALFLDLDTPVTFMESKRAIRKFMPQPSGVTISSAGKEHYYWSVGDCPIDAFKPAMGAMARILGGDHRIATLERVMRLPGFPNQKYSSHATKCVVFGGTHSWMDVVKAAAKATPIQIPATEDRPPAYMPKLYDTFGLPIPSEYKSPTSLPPGNRTGVLVSHAGHMIARGFSEEHTRAELKRMNVALCPPGKEPIPEATLEYEVLGCVATFADRRRAETAHHLPTVPKAPPPPPPQRPAQPDGVVVNNEIEQTDNNLDAMSLEGFLQRFIFLEENVRVIDRQRIGVHAIMQEREFRNKYANIPCGADGTMAKSWLTHPARQDVRTTTYMPSTSKIIHQRNAKAWNVYPPPPIKAAPEFDLERIAPFTDHIHFLFPRGEDRKLFLDWMAFTITRPQLRVLWCPLLMSEQQGAGKGMIFDIMSLMMGDENTQLITTDRIGSQFNSYLYKSTLICIDELKASNKYDMAEKLKTIITGTRQEINVKGVEEGQQNIYANVIILTNSFHAAVIEQKDRRYWVYRIENEYIPDAHHFKRLGLWMKDEENIAHALGWMHARDLRGFNRTQAPPMTQAKQDMIDAGKSDVELIIQDSIIDRVGPFAADVVTKVVMLDYCRAALSDAIVDRNEKLLNLIWSKHSKPLPANVNRVPVSADGRGVRSRARSVRNHARWKKAHVSQIHSEARRAAQMLYTPQSVDSPRMEIVK